MWVWVWVREGGLMGQQEGLGPAAEPPAAVGLLQT